MNIFDRIAFVVRDAPSITESVSVLYGVDSGVEVLMLRDEDGICHVVRVDRLSA